MSKALIDIVQIAEARLEIPLHVLRTQTQNHLRLKKQIRLGVMLGALVNPHFVAVVLVIMKVRHIRAGLKANANIDMNTGQIVPTEVHLAERHVESAIV